MGRGNHTNYSPKQNVLTLDKDMVDFIPEFLDALPAVDQNDEDQLEGLKAHLRDICETSLNRRELKDLAHDEGSGLKRDHELDQRLKQELILSKRSEKYQRLLVVRKNLPAFKMKNELVKAINDNQVVVISGETGCGKTTQVNS